MALFSEIDALFNLISKANYLLQGLRKRYIRARHSQEATQFADRVEELRRKQLNWNDLLRKHGHEAQKLVRPALDIAMEILEREDRVMQRRQGHLWYTCFEANLNVEEATNAIQIVVEAFEGIPRSIRDYNEANQILNEATAFSPAVLPFRSDEKYVPLQEPLEAVQRALESVDGSPVVILYGQPGSGKTSLAKYLALHYDEIRKQHQWRMAAGARGSTNCFLDGVFYLACGPRVTSKALHEELWQNLGFRATFTESNQQLPDFMPYSVDDTPDFESMLHKQLSARLTDSYALIILDDVWHTKVVEKILLPGKHLKYLVTSQNKRVWQDAVQIDMSNPTLETARKILFNHVVGLPVGHEVPPDVQEIANVMIRTSQFNPLVLANLASTISSERATDVDEWTMAEKYLVELLDDNDKGPVAFGETYPHTVALSMTIAVDSFPDKAENLLLLAAMCDGPSVPENVLKMFFKSLNGSLATFQKWSNYLEDHAFTQIETHVVEWSTAPQRAWSVHGLRRHFVLKEKKDKLHSVLSSLLGRKDDDSEIIAALFLLFTASSSTHEEEARVLLGISKERDTNFSWNSIKSLVLLLCPESTEEWGKKVHMLVKNIVVGYMRLGYLEDRYLSSLLEIPQAQVATCWVLETIARSEEKQLLTSGHEATLKKLLALLSETDYPERQSWGALVLGALAPKSHRIILTNPLALMLFVQLLDGTHLARGEHYNVQLYSAWAVGNLAATPSSKDVITSYPGMIDAFLALLSNAGDPDVQLQAAYALRRLAYGAQVVKDVESRQARLIAHPDMLGKLATLLKKGVDHDLQREAAWLLGNLASSQEEKVKIREYPGILNMLVDMLDTETRMFDIQRYRAIFALRRLTLKTGDLKIGSIPGALERLVTILGSGSTYEQHEAAHCLSVLFYPEDRRKQYAAIPGAVDGLIGLLKISVNPKTQVIAVGTLANLLEIDENKLILASADDAIDGLVRLLVNDDSWGKLGLELSQLAVRCLSQLSLEHFENQLKIARCPGVLNGLVGMLSRCTGSTTEKWMSHLAGWTICNLAEAQPNIMRIQAFPRAITGLRELLQVDDMDHALQTYIQDTLTLLEMPSTNYADVHTNSHSA